MVATLVERGASKFRAAERGLAVLESLVDRAPSAQLAEIAESADLPKPTTYRILQLLVSRGYAQQNGDGSYSPGFVVLRLASRIRATLDPLALARPVLLRLRDISGETVHLALLRQDRQEAVYVDKVEGTGSFRMASTVGMTVRLHSSSIGKAILATFESNELNEWLQRSELPARTPQTITDPIALRVELDSVRARGFAIDDQENELDIRCVGAAIYDHRGVIGAMSISAAAMKLDRVRAEQLGPIVAFEAASLSEGLGYVVETRPSPRSSEHDTDSPDRSTVASQGR